jgi:hypothetical protein
MAQPKRRAARLVCFHCSVDLKKADREHYGYQCHSCVIREHDLLIMQETDPEHPDLNWLDSIPVYVGPNDRG